MKVSTPLRDFLFCRQPPPVPPPSDSTAASLILGIVLGFIGAWCWQRWSTKRQARGEAELVALFCNPKMPRSLGLQQLSFGQDFKFLMRTLPHQLYVEPAASLYTTRRALVHHRPRFLMFSGHSLNSSHLCFETPDGRYDADAKTELLVALLLSLTSTSADRLPIPAVWIAAVERHLESQQAAALEMQHCSRAWMERAASERTALVAESAASPLTPPMPSRTHSLDLLRSVGSSWLPSPLRIGQSLLREGPEPQLALSRLLCVVLNACSSAEIGKAIVRALPAVSVVCWCAAPLCKIPTQ